MSLNTKKRPVIIAALGAAFVLLLFALTAFLTIRSNWFKEQLLARVIRRIENSTGGRVELNGFKYDWQTSTLTLRNVVIHGTEAPSTAPLFSAPSVQVRLRIPSLFSPEVNVSSLALFHPAIHLLVRPDGTTNIRSPKLRCSYLGGDVQA